MNAANERYLVYMAEIDNPSAGFKDIDKMSSPAKDQGRSFRSFNLFQKKDYQLFLTIGRGEWSVSGFRAADLRAHISDLSPSQSSYFLKRLRIHGLIKKIGRRILDCCAKNTRIYRCAIPLY